MPALLERLLRSLCVPPSDLRVAEASTRTAPHERTRELLAAIPELSRHIAGSRILDVGCGTGDEVVGLALQGAREVVGIDINRHFLEQGRAAAHAAGVADRVSFVEHLDPPVESFDVIFSHNSMEHFTDPEGVLRRVRQVMGPDTRFLIAFSPAWLSPYGAHMNFFTPVPWVHLLFPERVVMRVRSSYRDDGAMRYEDVDGGLNRMTIRKFFSLVHRTGFTVESKRLVAVKRLPAVTLIPMLREFLTVRVCACLRLRPDLLVSSRDGPPPSAGVISLEA